MSEQNIKITKRIYSENIREVIDTEFNQLVKFPKVINPTKKTVTAPLNDFFLLYEQYYFSIPPSGSDQSHLYLASKSLEALGFNLEDLQSEIEILREENVELKNQILLLTKINSEEI